MEAQYRSTRSDADQYAVLMEHYPGLRGCVLRLAEYSGHFLRTEDGRSLFEGSLDVAMEEWRLSCKLTTEPAKQQAYFLHGLLLELPNLQKIVVRGMRHGHIVEWDPIDQFITRWLRNISSAMTEEADESIYWAHFSPVDFRAVVAARLLVPPDVLRVVARYWDWIVGR